MRDRREPNTDATSPPHKPVIGIVGGIGAGKSAVANILQQLGCMVSDSDGDAKAALREPSIRDELVRWWGPDILDADGEISRAAVARLVFADKTQRRRLESLVHPWIEQRRKAKFAAAPPHVTAFVIDAPLLVEAGLHKACDALIFVDTPRELRLKRLAETRGWDEKELARREDSQFPLDVKRRLADYVVSNTGDLQALARQVQQVLQTIIHKPS